MAPGLYSYCTALHCGRAALRHFFPNGRINPAYAVPQKNTGMLTDSHAPGGRGGLSLMVPGFYNCCKARHCGRAALRHFFPDGRINPAYAVPRKNTGMLTGSHAPGGRGGFPLMIRGSTTTTRRGMAGRGGFCP